MFFSKEIWKKHTQIILFVAFVKRITKNWRVGNRTKQTMKASSNMNTPDAGPRHGGDPNVGAE